MENSCDMDLGPVWLNDKLFVINGTPLKFHLHGYDESKSRSMTRIIEDFGGEPSEPENPETFVFCERSLSCGALKGDRYHIKYFYDSIVAHEPEDLNSYKLKGSTDQPIACNMVVDDLTVEGDGGEDSDDSEDSMERLHMTSDEDDTSSFVDANQSSHFQNEGGTTDESPKMISHEPQVTTNQESTDPVDDDDSGYQHYREENHKFYGGESIAGSSSGTAPQNELTDGENSSTASRKRVHDNTQEGSARVKRSIKNVMEMAKSQPGNDDQDNDDHGAEGAKCASSSEEDQDSEDSWVPHEKPAKTRKNIPESKRKRVLWTEKENRVLIQYLIDHDAISQARTEKVWTECLEARKSSLQSTRTIASLQYHFDRHLRYNYAKYTNDPEALRKFKEIETAQSKDHKPWTEEENQVMMKYLIDNDVIHRARASKVWSECLKACKSSLHPTRTENRLYQHFRYKLRQEYAKYTDDPEVLRKFQEIEEIDSDYKGPSWTEEENRVLIQYLIDQDVIHEAGSIKVWRECLKARKSSLHSTRTDKSLSLHFRKKLRFNYEKYTKNPDAREKFRKILTTGGKKSS